MRLKSSQLSLQTPDTVVCATWIDEGRAAITVTYRDGDGATQPGIYQTTGTPLATLLQALKELNRLNARHCLVVTNSRQLVRMLRRPFQFDPAAPPTEWPVAYFDLLRTLTMYCRNGTWRALLAADLPKARELWQQQQNP